MEYASEFDETSGICTVRVTGRHKRPEDSLTLQQFARDFGQETGCTRFFFDMRGAEIVGGTMDIYMVGIVPNDSDHKQQRQMVALIYEGDLSDPKFMENVATNKGYQLHVFNDKDKAIEWLSSDNSSV